MLPFLSTRVNVVAAAFLIQATVIGLMFGYGVFFTVLEDELGWSRTLLSAASSLAVLVMGVFAIVAGQLSDRIGPRWVLTFTGVTTGLGYVLMSAMNAPWQLLFCFGLLVGLGFATHDVVTLSTVSSWYPRRRGFITGIIKTGSACGQVAVPLIVTWLIAVSSWRAALMTVGILSSLALIGLAQGMKRRPSEPALDQKKMVAAPNEARDGLSFEKARSTRTLWILCAIQFCFLPSMMTIPLHIVAHATDLGMTTTKAASVLSTLGAASIVGRLSIGHLFDRLGARRTLGGCLTLLAIALLLLRFVAVAAWLFPVALLYGVAHGGLFTVVSPAVAEYFGMKSHGAIFGSIVFFGTLSGAAGPVVAGMLFDRFSSYDIAFTILLFLAATGVLLAWSLPTRSDAAGRSVVAA